MHRILFGLSGLALVAFAAMGPAASWLRPDVTDGDFDVAVLAEQSRFDDEPSDDAPEDGAEVADAAANVASEVAGTGEKTERTLAVDADGETTVVCTSADDGPWVCDVAYPDLDDFADILNEQGDTLLYELAELDAHPNFAFRFVEVRTLGEQLCVYLLGGELDGCYPLEQAGSLVDADPFVTLGIEP